ncbi:MAG: DNA methyltransferase [Phycisphaerae bacterium]
MLTNEEKVLTIYADSRSSPTSPSEITPETPLENLNLNWREKDLPESERTKHVHRLHPYLGKFIPQLVEIFLRKYFKQSETVLDPFVGSGTTLVQANELGVNSIGYDISAFNVMLCQVKTAKYDVKQMRIEVLDILKKAKVSTHPYKIQGHLFESDRMEELENASKETIDQYLNEWFAPQALEELLTYRYLIENGSYKYKDLMRIILSRSARSARLTTHFDLDFPKRPQREPYWCHKHSRTCSPTQEAYKFLYRYSYDTIKRISDFANLRTNASVRVYHGDSRKMSMPAVDGVITSPPYVGLIDYHDQHAYSYRLLDLQENAKHEIGSASKGRNPRAVSQYKQDIVTVLSQALDVMPSGGPIIVVAHDRTELYPEIAQSLGVQTEATVKRHVNRRTGRRAGNFYESVFIWRKP